MKFVNVRRDIYTKGITVLILFLLFGLLNGSTFHRFELNGNCQLRRIRTTGEIKTIKERFKRALFLVKDCSEAEKILSELDQEFQLSRCDEIEIPQETVRAIDYLISARSKFLSEDEFIKLSDVVYDVLGLPNFNFTENDYNKSLWYKFLDPQTKEMVKRLQNLKYTIITNSSGKSMSLFRYLIEKAKEVVGEDFPFKNLSDKILIYTYGSYLYSPKPGDIDLRIYIKDSKLNIKSLYNSVVEVRIPKSSISVKAIGGGVVGMNSDSFSDRRLKGGLYYERIRIFGNDDGSVQPDESLVLLDVEHLIDLGEMNLNIVNSVRVNRGTQRLLTAGMILSRLYPNEIPLDRVKKLFNLNVESLEGNIRKEELKKETEEFLVFLREKMVLIKEKYHPEMNTQLYLDIVKNLINWTESKISVAPYEALHGIFRIYLWLDKALPSNYIKRATKIYKIIVDDVSLKKGKITEDLARSMLAILIEELETKKIYDQ